MWALLATTTAVGALTAWWTGRFTILAVAVGVLAILLYLLAGVHLGLRRERAEMASELAATLSALPPSVLVLIDASGVILYCSAEGQTLLGHPKTKLERQVLRSLVSPSCVASFGEVLRFGASGMPWSGLLEVVGEQGTVHKLLLETAPVDLSAQRRRWIALRVVGGQTD